MTDEFVKKAASEVWPRGKASLTGAAHTAQDLVAKRFERKSTVRYNQYDTTGTAVQFAGYVKFARWGKVELESFLEK